MHGFEDAFVEFASRGEAKVFAGALSIDWASLQKEMLCAVKYAVATTLEDRAAMQVLSWAAAVSLVRTAVSKGERCHTLRARDGDDDEADRDSRGVAGGESDGWDDDGNGGGC